MGEAAQRVGITADALRYYEREELLQVSRTGQGHRCYSEQDLEWLGVLMCLRETGMPIHRVRDFARLVRADAPGTYAERVELLERHREDVVERIRVLGENLAKLDRKIAWYRDRLGGTAGASDGGPRRARGGPARPATGTAEPARRTTS